MLLIIVVKFLLCLIYKVHFIKGMYVLEKNSPHRAGSCPQFQASAGGLGTHVYPMNKGEQLYVNIYYDVGDDGNAHEKQKGKKEDGNGEWGCSVTFTKGCRCEKRGGQRFSSVDSI